jgi:hypothetical protein
MPVNAQHDALVRIKRRALSSPFTSRACDDIACRRCGILGFWAANKAPYRKKIRTSIIAPSMLG